MMCIYNIYIYTCTYTGHTHISIYIHTKLYVFRYWPQALMALLASLI